MEAVMHKLNMSVCEFTGEVVGYCETCYSPDFDSYSGKFVDFTDWRGTKKDVAYEFYEHVLEG